MRSLSSKLKGKLHKCQTDGCLNQTDNRHQCTDCLRVKKGVHMMTIWLTHKGTLPVSLGVWSQEEAIKFDGRLIKQEMPFMMESTPTSYKYIQTNRVYIMYRKGDYIKLTRDIGKAK